MDRHNNRVTIKINKDEQYNDKNDGITLLAYKQFSKKVKTYISKNIIIESYTAFCKNYENCLNI